MKKTTLIKNENQYSYNKVEFDVLSREEVENILNNIDRDKIKDKLMQECLDYSTGFTGSVHVELGVETGEVFYGLQLRGSEQLKPDLYITLYSKKLVDIGDIEDNCLLYMEEMDRISELINNEDLDYQEAYDRVICEENIDIDERIKEYFFDSLIYDIEEYDINSQLDRIYNNNEDYYDGEYLWYED